jgi:hypothetical protein
MSSIEVSLMQGLYGALGSFFLNGSIYLKSTGTEGFDVVKFLKSVLVGAGVGFAVGMTGISEDIVMGSPIYASAGMAIENLLKMLFRKDTKLKQAISPSEPVPKPADVKTPKKK